MRGEDHCNYSLPWRKKGSPPHARGRHADYVRTIPALRITPACAGKTYTNVHFHMGHPDHPRMRGEDRPESRGSAFEQGSPPHARGRLPNGNPSKESFRITPACAGKTRLRTVSSAGLRDHPRMRGEDVAAVREEVQKARITPACAGKTPTTLWRIVHVSDHPRMRGEDWWGAKQWHFLLGSPPHARGRLASDSSIENCTRITPACAGKTLSAGRVRLGHWDHPRMRGEDFLPMLTTAAKGGSPPHARGRRVFEVAGLLAARITPACAGKT